MELSIDGKLLVTLHINGRICLWNIPSMRLHKTWSKSEQVCLMFFLNVTKVVFYRPQI